MIQPLLKIPSSTFMSWEASFHHRDFQGTFEIQTIIQTLFFIAVTKYQPKELHEGRVCFVSWFEVIMHPGWEARAVGVGGNRSLCVHSQREVGVGGSRSQCVHSQKEECWLSFSSLFSPLYSALDPSLYNCAASHPERVSPSQLNLLETHSRIHPVV